MLKLAISLLGFCGKDQALDGKLEQPISQVFYSPEILDYVAKFKLCLLTVNVNLRTLLWLSSAPS